MSALQRIQQTRHALVDAMQAGDWDAIGVLDIECRACVDSVLQEVPEDPLQLRSHLEDLLEVYRQLLNVTRLARQSVVDEMSQFTQAKNAAKVYHLFR
ncbi:flagellar protein FliT [Pseudomonas sp. CFBP 8770]|jgi:flagellar protein FliT|uniref:flagellar protein FliT n=1 Tax=unclassified Pseudomonas TaxID=196821 RepID=UPI000F052D27|nr:MULTISPECIES: flagellar protein FliT [unclassified Pseudomonas]MBD8473582.1 flagellar protein FliT [Pseudomonas sp. CFBP 8773]MBD8646709.1 flagellar protein FliT [Pseudomonas sp. CFBP 8770]MBD8683766.1 flagellar protein FliT [Pseudomonas sp. CFBP 13719]